MGGGSAPNPPRLSADFITDPYDPRIRTFDNSGQKQALMRDISRAGGAARAQTLASQAQALGGSRSTGTAGMLADIGAQQGYAQQKVLADLAGQEFNQRLGVLDILNNITQAKNSLQADQFNMGMGRYNAQRSQRQGDINSILNALGIGGALVAGGGG